MSKLQVALKRLIDLRATLGALEDEVFDQDLGLAIKIIKGEEYPFDKDPIESLDYLVEAIERLNDCYDDEGREIDASVCHEALGIVAERKTALLEEIIGID